MSYQVLMTFKFHWLDSKWH